MDWRNIVAFTVWQCKLCGKVFGEDGIARHLHEVHGIRSVEFSCDGDTAYSENFEYPNVKE